MNRQQPLALAPPAGDADWAERSLFDAATRRALGSINLAFLELAVELAEEGRHAAGKVGGAAEQPVEALHAVGRDEEIGVVAGVQLACVTNKERLHAERVLAATGLAHWFPTLLAGDTLPYKKPDARVLGELLRRQGVTAPQAAHVGDSSIDIEAARNAAVAAWAVPHGYNGGRPIAEAQPDRLFADLGAVADFVCAARMVA